jgi:hypothetical protein
LVGHVEATVAPDDAQIFGSPGMDVGRVVEPDGWIRGEVGKSGDTRRDARRAR